MTFDVQRLQWNSSDSNENGDGVGGERLLENIQHRMIQPHNTNG